jgi:tRNA(fMet)-specific endonuclease VapC
MKYLLDTNVISELIKKQPNQQVIIRYTQSQSEIAIASPVWHELLFGYMRLPTSRNRDYFKAFLYDVIQPSIPILPYNETAALWHAQERSRLTEQGKTPSFVDGQIASIAVIYNLVLVTHNVKDFQNFFGLAMEDWHE